MTIIEAKEAAKRIGTELRCGDCTHFKTGPSHPMYTGLCKDLGKKPYSTVCQYFDPDITVMTKAAPEPLVQLASIYAAFDAQQLRILAHLMGRKSWFERARVTFGQKVFVCLGDQFLSNYVHGYVISVTKDAEEVHIVSTLEGLQKKQAVARMLRSSIMTEQQFAKVRTQLIKSDRVLEPESKVKPSTMALMRMTKKELKEYQDTLLSTPEVYTPPSIDTVPTQWLDKRALKSLKGKKPGKPKTDNKPITTKRK